MSYTTDKDYDHPYLTSSSRRHKRVERARGNRAAMTSLDGHSVEAMKAEVIRRAHELKADRKVMDAKLQLSLRMSKTKKQKAKKHGNHSKKH